MPEHQASASAAWQPVLEPDDAALAWQAISAIVDDLQPRHQRDAQSAREFSLAGGDAGISTFLSYLVQARPGLAGDAAERRDQYLARAVSGLSSQSMDASLHGGFSGIAWAVQQQSDAPSEADSMSAIDDALAAYLEAPSPGIDVISGLAGIGIYLLDRLPLPAARVGLGSIVRALGASAERSAAFTTWRVPPSALDEGDRALYPEGRYDLGVAHGIPGVIAFLARVHAAGIAPDESGSLLEAATGFLLSQVSRDTPSPRFPYWSAPVGPAPETRIAWCYGDLGVALALLVAGTSCERRDWIDYSLELARAVAERAELAGSVADGGLCHGTAGAGHMFNRLFQFSGDAHFLSAARFWFRETLALRQPGEGVGGYRSLIRNAALEDVWIGSPELLSGAAGIGLALLAACTSLEPSWDRVLLISPLSSGVRSVSRGA